MATMKLSRRTGIGLLRRTVATASGSLVDRGHKGVHWLPTSLQDGAASSADVDLASDPDRRPKRGATAA